MTQQSDTHVTLDLGPIKDCDLVIDALDKIRDTEPQVCATMGCYKHARRGGYLRIYCSKRCARLDLRRRRERSYREAVGPRG